MSKKVIREFKSQLDGKVKRFELTKEENVRLEGKTYSHTYWVQVESEMENESPEVIEFLCRKEEEESLDYSTLKTECLQYIEK